MNAISGAVSEQMEAHLEAFEADDDLWIGIVESSHPKTFCAGADLKAINKGENIQTAKGGFAGIVAFPRTKPLIPAAGGLFRLPRKIPHAVAMELMLTGDPMTCE